MERLNYHHLLYFCMVAHEGSVARASLRLGLKQPTVSAQIHALEEKLGRKLLERSGRGLRVTQTGETVLRYAESIFALGGELLSAVNDDRTSAPKLAVGVSSSLPPALVAHLLDPIFALDPKPELTIVEGALETFAAQLALRSLQFALSDLQPEDVRSVPGNGVAGKLHCRVLLESTVEVFAPEALARRVRKDFPGRLAGKPVLMPSGNALQREVEGWLKSHNLRPETLAKMPHPEICAVSAGAAIFAPSLLRESLKRVHGLLPVGKLVGSRWRIFIVTAEKGINHPGLDAVTRAAKCLR
jgi:LysR family transcriptional activator of nhaA